MVLPVEDFICLLLQLVLRGAGQVMDRLASCLVQKQAWRVQVLLDFLETQHFTHGLVVEDHLVTALPIVVADTLAILLLALHRDRVALYRLALKLWLLDGRLTLFIGLQVRVLAVEVLLRRRHFKLDVRGAED